MADTSTPDAGKLSKLEHIKESSRQLRGTIAEELKAGVECFNGENLQLLKHHGSYQQDDRDRRNDKDAEGKQHAHRSPELQKSSSDTINLLLLTTCNQIICFLDHSAQYLPEPDLSIHHDHDYSEDDVHAALSHCI